ncbi:hypothetical protein ACC691_36680, partial [Rhizobium johnstonii]|uniref:hypothetical protein n=1 Tax=Rhizobium johnstonii TaxID=3019933 RepID=UPI003F99B990
AMLQNCYIACMTKALIDHLNAVTGNASSRAMGERIGMVHTTLRKQLIGDDTPASTVVALCRAYGVPLAPAFIAAGFITEQEARAFSGPMNLSTITDLELSKEMLRRVVAGTASTSITEPYAEEIVDEVVR